MYINKGKIEKNPSNTHTHTHTHKGVSEQINVSPFLFLTNQRKKHWDKQKDDRQKKLPKIIRALRDWIKSLFFT